MKPPETYLFLAWLVFALVATSVALFMIERRGRRTVVFAVLMIVGAAGTYPLFDVPFSSSKAGVGAVGLLIAGFATIGFRRHRLRTDRCPTCGYHLIGEDERSSPCCPECGEARPTMAGHCLACREDIRQAIAGGSITCPHCGTDIPPERRDR